MNSIGFQIVFRKNCSALPSQWQGFFLKFLPQLHSSRKVKISLRSINFTDELRVKRGFELSGIGRFYFWSFGLYSFLLSVFTLVFGLKTGFILGVWLENR